MTEEPIAGGSKRPFQRMSTNKQIQAHTMVTRRELGALRPRRHKRIILVKSRLGGLLLADVNTYDEALLHLEDSLKSCQYVDAPRLQATTWIRYATALQYVGRHQDSLSSFDEALAFIVERRLRKLRDFALQHKGKCLVEVGLLNEALRCFEAALRIRRKRKEKALIRSTTFAMAAVKRKLTAP
jgi:tetratricopeptide (TPR) repeat protein